MTTNSSTPIRPQLSSGTLRPLADVNASSASLRDGGVEDIEYAMAYYSRPGVAIGAARPFAQGMSSGYLHALEMMVVTSKETGTKSLSVEGVSVIRDALTKVSKGDVGLAPFTLSGTDAREYLRGTAKAYSDSLQVLVDTSFLSIKPLARQVETGSTMNETRVAVEDGKYIEHHAEFANDQFRQELHGQLATALGNYMSAYGQGLSAYGIPHGPQQIEAETEALAALQAYEQISRASAERPAEALEPLGGFVLAFPGASEVECEELVEMLKRGGSTVFRVEDAIARPVLQEALMTSGLDAEDPEP